MIETSTGQIHRYLCDELTKPLPVFSHAVVHGGVAYISCIQGFKPGGFVLPDEVADEAAQMMNNLSKVLAGVGSDFTKILKMSLFFSNLDRDFPAVNDVVNKYISSDAPARSSIGVAALPRGARVVVECVAVPQA